MKKLTTLILTISTLFLINNAAFAGDEKLHIKTNIDKNNDNQYKKFSKILNDFVDTKYIECNNKVNKNVIFTWVNRVLYEYSGFDGLFEKLNKNCGYIADNSIKFKNLNDVSKEFIYKTNGNTQKLASVSNSFEEKMLKLKGSGYTIYDTNNIVYEILSKYKKNDKH
jgi:hypothetical protein